VDVAAWLRDLGLQQYEPAFRKEANERLMLPSMALCKAQIYGRAIGIPSLAACINILFDLGNGSFERPVFN
jgi:hypothetical protein